jgi:hypothetical protein
MALFLGFTVVGSAAADPLTDVGNTLNDAGLTVDVPTVPQVTVPHTGVAPVDGIVDTVNDTLGGATDTVNDTTGRLGGGGGGGSTEPPASTPPTSGSQPTDQPVDTGSPAPAQTGGGSTPEGSAPQGGGNGANAGNGAAAGGAAGAAAGAGAVSGPRGGRGPAAPPAPESERTAPTEGALITIAGAVPWSLFVLTLAFAAIGVVMSIRSALRARRNRILRKESGELRQDVGAMQAALLPVPPARIGETEIAAAYRPAEGPAAGGDFHDVLALPDGRIGIVVGDVCGHGRAALANTALVHYTVRAYLEAGLEPRESLRLANQALADKLGDDFVAAVTAVYDPATSTLDYATAGHPTPLIAGERDRAVGALTPPPIGVGLHTGHRQTRIHVRPGSRIWFFTDGLVEARAENGDLLGREGLATILAETGEAGPEALLTSIAGHGGPRDDMTTLVLAPADAAGDGRIEEEIDVDRHLIAGDGLARFLVACGLDPGEVERALQAAERRLRLAGSARIRTRSGAVGPRWEIFGTPGAEIERTAAVPAGNGATASATEGATIVTASRP